jgi:predicted protein tyrosine phosphatase
MFILPGDVLEDALKRHPGKPAQVILCRTGDDGKLSQLATKFLHLKFDDITREMGGGVMEGVKDGKYTLPGKHHVQQAIEFDKSRDKNLPLFVCCRAGISRSTAMAFSIMVARGMEPMKAVDMVFALVPYASPNLDIVNFGLLLAGKVQHRVRVVEAIKQKKREWESSRKDIAIIIPGFASAE